MRLRSGRIAKRESRNPVRRYVRKIMNPRNNNNGEQPANSIGEGTITATSTEPFAFIASMTAIPSTAVMPSNTHEGMVFPL